MGTLYMYVLLKECKVNTDTHCDIHLIWVHYTCIMMYVLLKECKVNTDTHYDIHLIWVHYTCMYS